MISDIKDWSTEELFKDLFDVKTKYEVLRFLGISMGGVLLFLQAISSYIRAKAMEDAAKAQAKATEEQAMANENTEKGRRQERLKNAIEHLGHEAVSVRLGGAYELFHLARDTYLAQNTEDLRQTVLDILCAHIRQTTGKIGYQEAFLSKPSEEIQSLLTLLFVQEHKVFEGLHINLQGSWLNGANLRKAYLEKAILIGTHLQGAYLIGVHLHEANLFRTHLSGARLDMAHLCEANLLEAHLHGAILAGARLYGANLIRAHLQRTSLRMARLYGADLNEARLHGASLYKAHLQGANLNEVHLQEVNLSSAKLQGVRSDGRYTMQAFADRMRDAINKESDLSKVIFKGGLIQTDVDSSVEGLLDEQEKELLRANLEPHIDQPASHQLPENSGAITGIYTEEEAEEWIAEYKEVMSGIPEEDDS